MLAVAMVKHRLKAAWRGKGLSGLYFHVTVHPRGKARRELKAGSWKQDPCLMAAYWLILLACLLVQLAFLYSSDPPT